MNQVSLFFLNIMLVLFTPAALATLTVEALVNRAQVGVGDVIYFEVRVTSTESVQVGQPRIQANKSFEIIGSQPGSSSTMSTFQNGRFSTQQTNSFVIVLSANEKGKFTLGPAEIDVNGQTFKTNTVNVLVTAERTNPSPLPQVFEDESDDVDEMFNQMLQRRFGQPFPGQKGVPGRQLPNVNPEEAFFIQADVDKEEAFVGEQIIVSFYLYTRGQVRDIDTLKYPDLKGFWKEDLEMATRLNFEGIVVNNIPYQRALLVSYALFPIKAGKVMIDSYKAKCTVISPTSFGFGRPYQFTKISKPIAINVQEIPTTNRPANFTGGVGQFRVAAGFEPATGVANQPVTLRVRFEGRGNAKLIELPKLELPPSFELYDQKNQAKFLKDGTSFKEFEVLLIPREPGIFDLPPLKVSQFDPSAVKFVEISSEPLRLNVTGVAMANTALPTMPGKAPEEENAKLPPLALEMGRAQAASSLPLVGTVALGLLSLVALVYQYWRQFINKTKKQTLNLVLNQRLKKIHVNKNQSDRRAVGVEMTNTIYFVLGHLSDLGGASQDLDRLLEASAPSLRNELAPAIREVLAKCEALSFAPDGIRQEINEELLLKMISEVERVLKRAIELADVE